jgi:hypothetical protein
MAFAKLLIFSDGKLLPQGGCQAPEIPPLKTRLTVILTHQIIAIVTKNGFD